jgi:hypothetical protein
LGAWFAESGFGFGLVAAAGDGAFLFHGLIFRFRRWFHFFVEFRVDLVRRFSPHSLQYFLLPMARRSSIMNGFLHSGQIWVTFALNLW